MADKKIRSIAKTFSWRFLIFGIVWLITFVMFKYSSLSSIVGALSVPIINFLFFNDQIFYFFIIMFILIFYTHRENIKRLLNRTESKTKIY